MNYKLKNNNAIYRYDLLTFSLRNKCNDQQHDLKVNNVV